jgi:hypothetical protein
MKRGQIRIDQQRKPKSHDLFPLILFHFPKRHSLGREKPDPYGKDSIMLGKSSKRQESKEKDDSCLFFQ